MDQNFFVAGVGSSAGGLEALQDMLSHLPEDLTNCAFIVAQHLSPSYKSRLRDLLSRETDRRVEEISDNQVIAPNTIYITPPDNDVVVKQGRLRLHKPINSIGPKPSVNILFHSLAIEYQEHAVGIILSGTGQDGATGLREIRDAGGFAICQEPASARYDGMPNAAVQTGRADFILEAGDIGNELNRLILRQSNSLTAEAQQDEYIRKIIAKVSRYSKIDFSGYKDSTIERRITKRLAALRLDSPQEYYEHIQQNPKETAHLFSMLLIGVTQFFRDPESYEKVIEELTTLISSRQNDDVFRIWIAGCSTGEEAYSLAMVLDNIRKSLDIGLQIQVFATDIDEKAVNFARRGAYPEESLIDIPEEYRERYFTRDGERIVISKDIRQMILFSVHDVIESPPFLRLDLISCRNLLIYLDQKIQKQILPIFHYALRPKGILFLGKSETIGQFSDLFTPLDSRHRVFQRTNEATLPRSLYRGHPGSRRSRGDVPTEREEDLTIRENIKETLFADLGHPYLVINAAQEVVRVQGDLHSIIGIREGIFTSQLSNMLASELKHEVTQLLNRASSESRTISSPFRRYFPTEPERLLRIRVRPLVQSAAAQGYMLVEFEPLEIAGDIMASLMGEAEGDGPEHQRIRELENELTLKNENLQNYIEELETGNEELQSLNEELQSTNEELQSSNEELETSNEELQASNEELQVAYTEIKSINEQLARQDRELVKAQTRIDMALWGGKLAWWEWNIASDTEDFAPTRVKMLGYNEDSFPHSRKDYLKLIHPEDIEENQRIMDEHLKGARPIYDAEYRIRNFSGTYVWYWDKGRVVEWDDQGRPIRVVGLATDITDRKHSELELEEKIEEREVLIREVHHRVKNNFNTVIGLIELEISRLSDSSQRGLLRDIQGRIRSMALIHAELYQRENIVDINLRDYLTRLGDAIVRFQSLENHNVHFFEDIETLYMDVSSSLTLGLILVELMTNSMKYAVYDKGTHPELRIGVKRLEDGRLQLRYRDNGQGYPPDIISEKRYGVGLDLVMSMTRQLEGNIRLLNEQGAVCELSIPYNEKQRPERE